MRWQGISAAALVALVGLSGGAALADVCEPQWTGPLPPEDGLDGLIHDMVVYDDGTGPALYVGGSFTWAYVESGPIRVNHIARWDGTSWSPLGQGQNPGISTGSNVFALCVFDEDGAEGPNPPALFVGGSFSYVGGYTPARNIARWNGSGWTGVGGGVYGEGTPTVYALAVYDADGDEGPNPPALYLGGHFSTAGTVTDVSNVVRWNGSGWAPLGEGVDAFVNALVVFDDDGPGEEDLPALYAGGGFIAAGGSETNHIAKWNGVFWSDLMPAGTFIPGVNNTVNIMHVHDDDGSGPHLPALYVGGRFTRASGTLVGRIVKWGRSNPTTDPTWSIMGSGVDGYVYALQGFDDNRDGVNTLYAGGVFTVAGGVTARHIAQWDGQAWSPMGLGVENEVRAMAVFDPDGAGDAPDSLFVGGDVVLLNGDIEVGSLGVWSCVASLLGDLNCDGVVNFDDIDPFVLALSSEAGYNAAYPDCYWYLADCNEDGSVDFDDIDAFVEILAGG